VTLPRITYVDGHPRLSVDGRPFLILGVQWDCDSCFSAEDGTGWAANEFLLVGVGFAARFRRPRSDGRPVPIVSAEWGRFERDLWKPLHPIRRERPESAGAPITLREPGVARVILDP